MSTADFVEILGQFKGLKSGISGTRIKKLTEIAGNNVSSESEIVDLVFENLKTIQDSHKLGALYIIDSIARNYKDRSNKLGETVTSDARQGTYAHGLYKFNSIISEAVDITVPTLTPELKEKVSKLLDIWKKVGVFDLATIEAIKAKHFPSSASVTPQPASANAILSSLAALTQAQPQAVQPQAAAPVAAQPAPVIPGFPNVADPAAQQAMVLQMLQQLQSSGQLPPPPQPPVPQQQQSQLPQQQSGEPRSRYKGAIGGSQADAFKTYKTAGPNFRERDSGFSRRNRDASPSRNQDTRTAPPSGHVAGERNYPGTPHYRERFVSEDPSLPNGSIKVLSRTLFIGGVPNYMSEAELAAILRPYAEVQSVILNNERKHAFVKVYSRKEAENIISGFNKNGQYNLRTRWGVGFGPRDCCDYQHGMSIIPISRLTDADTRWINAAEWGGIGTERPLAPGLVMEEPDIEIGEGISSKAISQKMPTDGSRNGPRSTKPGEPDDIYTDPLNQASLPSFMQGNTKANPLANLFGGQGQSAFGGAAPAPAPAPAIPQQAAPAADPSAANAQLSNLMAFLQSQQK